jgi:Uma2 family endonuclease
MAPERARHNIVKKRIARALDDAVLRAGLPCVVFTDGITVIIDDDTSYEPDAVVQCGASVDLDSLVAAKPTIVVEVTSPPSEKTDAAGKLADYLTLQSITHVLIVDPVRKLVVHHQRGDGSVIATRILRGNEELRMAPPGLSLAVSEFFGGV